MRPMTTQTTTPQMPAKDPSGVTSGLVGIPPHIGRALATGGGVLTVVSAFLA